MVLGIYPGKAVSVVKKQPIEYVILEDGAVTDVAIISSEPFQDTDNLVFGDTAKGVLEEGAKILRRTLTVLRGELYQPPNTGLYKLDEYEVVSRISAEELYKTIYDRIMKIRENPDKADEIRSFTLDKWQVRIIRYKPARTWDDVIEAVRDIYATVTASRKRIMVALPVVTKILTDNGEVYAIGTISRLGAAIQQTYSTYENFEEMEIAEDASILEGVAFIGSKFNIPVLLVKAVDQAALPGLVDQINTTIELLNALELGETRMNV